MQTPYLGGNFDQCESKNSRPELKWNCDGVLHSPEKYCFCVDGSIQLILYLTDSSEVRLALIEDIAIEDQDSGLG